MAVEYYINHLRTRDIISFVFGIISGIVLVYSLSITNVYSIHDPTSNLRDSDNSGIPIPMDPFPEEPWRTPSTLAARVGSSFE